MSWQDVASLAQAGRLLSALLIVGVIAWFVAKRRRRT